MKKRVFGVAVATQKTQVAELRVSFCGPIRVKQSTAKNWANQQKSKKALQKFVNKIESQK